MKIAGVSETSIITFKPSLLADFIRKKLENQHPEDSISIVPETIISFSKPILKEIVSPDKYEFTVSVQLDHESQNPAEGNTIIKTRKSFLYTKSGLGDEKVFFEISLNHAYNEFCDEFYYQFEKLKKGARGFDAGFASFLDSINFTFIKLGSKYYPLPIIDYKSFF